MSAPTPQGEAHGVPEAPLPAEARSPLWDGVDRFIERVVASGAGVEGLLAHKLGPLAADWYERSGADVPAALHEEKRSALLAMLIATPLVRRIREHVDGPLVLLKGPEVAALYPAGGRRFSDIDVLTPLAADVQAGLLRSGFIEVADESYSVLVDHHHLQPIRFPAIWLNVEVHSAPNWPPRTPSPPPLDEILEAVVPSALAIAGVSAPDRMHHALVLASHAWRHEPLSRMRDLIDIAALAEGLPEAELTRTARRWGIGRLWETTRAASYSLLEGGKETLALRLLGPHLRTARDRTVLENHVVHWLSPYWGLPPARALAQTMRTVQIDLAPTDGESWGSKLRRTAHAVSHPRSSAAKR